MPPSSDLSHLRQIYSGGKLERADLAPDPVEQFRQWFEQARADENILEPNAMSLATVGAQGQPNIRTILLKGFDQDGFLFFTNYQSAKAREIEENGQVALLFQWLPLKRQLKIRGRAERISTAESLKYFLSRPRGSRLGAWVSKQSSVISSRSLLAAKLQEMKRKFANGEVPCPSFWGGYRVIPECFEFWQGGRNRLHDRFQYTRTEDETEWTVQRLAP